MGEFGFSINLNWWIFSFSVQIDVSWAIAITATLLLGVLIYKWIGG